LDSSNRINQISLTQTIARQTPPNDFGEVLARTVGETVQNGAAVAGGLVMGVPVISAAVSSVRAASALNVAGATPSGQMTTASSAAGSSGAIDHGDDWDLLEAQKLMRSDERRFNAEYVRLQNEMQRESREFNAVTNILKVRHDSAKAAISNIR
jgi:hypothetical protein